MVHSPASSVDSSDAAFFAMLGIANLDVAIDTECDKDDGSTSSVGSTYAELFDPPASCHRPNTPHGPLLLVNKTRTFFSRSQCDHIRSIGYKASNDGGIHHGPVYITTARNGTTGEFVKLLKPNHHKVCVFQNAVILRWITAHVREHFTDQLDSWSTDNDNSHGSSYDLSKDLRRDATSSPTAQEVNEAYNFIVNPRLRLLRYDACDKDEFLPHYDTTTTCRDGAGVNYESKLTILLYLNTGCGTGFAGGETLFLNSLNPNDNLVVTPERGKMLIFNHELYHSSNELLYDAAISIDDGRDEEECIVGGSKFVLRSDIMFKKQ